MRALSKFAVSRLEHVFSAALRMPLGTDVL